MALLAWLLVADLVLVDLVAWLMSRQTVMVVRVVVDVMMSVMVVMEA